MATFLPYIAMASSAVSGFASMRASQSEANALDAQASQSEFQGRVNALQHRKQGNEILRRMNSIIATNIARGSARGLNPLASGEAVDMVNAYNRKYGVDEILTSRDSAEVAREMSKYQASQYRTSASTLRKLAPLKMFGSVSTGLSTAYQINPNFAIFQGFDVTPTKLG